MLLSTAPVLRTGEIERLWDPGYLSASAAQEDSVTIYGQTFAAAIHSGDFFCFINGNRPLFSPEELFPEEKEGDEQDPSVFVRFSEPDELGRTGPAWACLDTSLFPGTDREEMLSYEPSGWHSTVYDFIEGGYLYNRCHLIAWQLAGTNDPRGLVTGTRCMNNSGMPPFERMAAQYLYNTEKTGGRLFLRVTPVYENDELLCRGVLMEAAAASGGFCFCVFCPNTQPGIRIDYRNGDSAADPDYTAAAEDSHEETDPDASSAAAYSNTDAPFVLNIRTGKFHRPDCDKVAEIYWKNILPYHGTAAELTEAGYEPCGYCVGK